MAAVVIYESMYGNTHLVAEEIAEGLWPALEVTVLSLHEATAGHIENADLVVVGGPTHVHGMVRPTSRKAAIDAAGKDPDLALDPDAEGDGLREWFDDLAPVEGIRAAAFDTKMGGPSALTGRASKGIARRLRGHGFQLVDEPHSFLVDKENHLEADEVARARAWGAALAAAVAGDHARR